MWPLVMNLAPEKQLFQKGDSGQVFPNPFEPGDFTPFGTSAGTKTDRHKHENASEAISVRLALDPRSSDVSANLSRAGHSGSARTHLGDDAAQRVKDLGIMLCEVLLDAVVIKQALQVPTRYCQCKDVGAVG